MLGSRLCLTAVSLGLVAWSTSVSECQSILTDLSSDFKDTCADLCDFYGRKYPQICGDVDVIDCILQWHSEQCGLGLTPNKVTTRKPAATKKPTTKKLTTTTKKPTTTTKKTTTTTKKPTTTTKKPTSTTKKPTTTTTTKKPTTTTTTKKSTTKPTTTTVTTKKLTTTTRKPTTSLRATTKATTKSGTTTTTTTNYWESSFPLQCVIDACRIRVEGVMSSNDAFCRDECDRIGATGAPHFCPEAAFGEEYLMKCMVEEYYPTVCRDTLPVGARVCTFKEDCVINACRDRVLGNTSAGTHQCQDACASLLAMPKQCPMVGKSDDALAACVVQRGNNCTDKLAGAGPRCKAQIV